MISKDIQMLTSKVELDIRLACSADSRHMGANLYVHAHTHTYKYICTNTPALSLFIFHLTEFSRFLWQAGGISAIFNNSHKLEISSGCLLLLSYQAPVWIICVGQVSPCYFHNCRLTICCWLCYCVSARNVGMIWHFAITAGSDHKSAQDGVNKRVRDGLLIYAVYFSGIWWDGRDRERKEKWR